MGGDELGGVGPAVNGLHRHEVLLFCRGHSIASMKVSIPFDKTLNTVLEGRRGSEVYGAAKIADIGASLQDVAGRQGHICAKSLTTKGSLDDCNQPVDLLGPIIADIVHTIWRRARSRIRCATIPIRFGTRRGG